MVGGGGTEEGSESATCEGTERCLGAEKDLGRVMGLGSGQRKARLGAQEGFRLCSGFGRSLRGVNGRNRGIGR